MLHRRGSFYYSRVIIPVSIRAVLLRHEVLKSLNTTDRPTALLRCAAWEGKLAEAFLLVHNQLTTAARSTMDQGLLRQLVQRYIQDRIEEWEKAWYQGEHPAADSMSTCHSDDGGTPSEHQWQDHLAAFSDSAIKDHADALKRNDLRTIEPIAEEFIKRHSLALDKASPLYRVLCRELLVGEQRIAKAIAERVQGNYLEPEALAAQPAAHPAPVAPAGPAVPQQPRLFSAAMVDYLKHFANRAPNTLKEKKVMLSRFIAVAGGDRPVHEITKQACIKYRDTLGQEVSQARVNILLGHIGHFFKWAINHEHYPDINLPDGTTRVCMRCCASGYCSTVCS